MCKLVIVSSKTADYYLTREDNKIVTSAILLSALKARFGFGYYLNGGRIAHSGQSAFDYIYSNYNDFLNLRYNFGIFHMRNVKTVNFSKRDSQPIIFKQYVYFQTGLHDSPSYSFIKYKTENSAERVLIDLIVNGFRRIDDITNIIINRKRRFIIYYNFEGYSYEFKNFIIYSQIKLPYSNGKKFNFKEGIDEIKF